MAERHETRARDGDRRSARQLVGRALAQGRISAPDHDLRLERIESAATLDELDALVRDLVVPTDAPDPQLPPEPALVGPVRDGPAPAPAAYARGRPPRPPRAMWVGFWAVALVLGGGNILGGMLGGVGGEAGSSSQVTAMPDPWPEQGGLDIEVIHAQVAEARLVRPDFMAARFTPEDTSLFLPGPQRERAEEWYLGTDGFHPVGEVQVDWSLHRWDEVDLDRLEANLRRARRKSAGEVVEVRIGYDGRPQVEIIAVDWATSQETVLRTTLAGHCPQVGPPSSSHQLACDRLRELHPPR